MWIIRIKVEGILNLHRLLDNSESYRKAFLMFDGVFARITDAFHSPLLICRLRYRFKSLMIGQLIRSFTEVPVGARDRRIRYSFRNEKKQRERRNRSGDRGEITAKREVDQELNGIINQAKNKHALLIR